MTFYIRTFATSIFISLFILLGCTSKTQVDTCNAPEGWEIVADRAKGEILIIGEIHGTNEIPDAFAAYVCAVANRGEHVIVGLEINEFFADSLMSVAKSENIEQTLIEQMKVSPQMNHWALKDGRGSQSMLRNMVKLYALGNVEIVPFLRPQQLEIPEHLSSQEDIQAWINKLDPETSQKKHEISLASALSDRKKPGETMIVLVGNLHAAKARLEHLPTVDPMAMLLPPTTLTLNAEYDDGESSHPSHDLSSAQSYPTQSNRKGTPPNASKLIMGFSDTLNPHYDGYLYVGTITPSAPVIEP